MAGRIDQRPDRRGGQAGDFLIARAFPEIGRFYLKEVIGRGLPLLEGLIVRGMEQGDPGSGVDQRMTVRSIVGAMLLAGIWRTVFEPIGADKLEIKALARHHADLMLHALKPDPWGRDVMKRLFARLPKRAIFVAIAALLATLLVTRGSWQQPVLSDPRHRGRKRPLSIAGTSRARPA